MSSLAIYPAHIARQVRAEHRQGIYNMSDTLAEIANRARAGQRDCAGRPIRATPLIPFKQHRDRHTAQSEQEKVGAGSTASSNAPADDDGSVIARLAALSLQEYDRVRKQEAEALGIRPATLDKLVQTARKRDSADDGMGFDDVAPWPDPVNGARLLTEISETVRRFIVCDKETADAVALWVAMTWLIDVVQVAPLAVITAPEKRCGKSQLLSFLRRLVYRALAASNISPAALFRAVDAWKPTLLVDEADSFMRENEELRGIINAGHTRDSAYVVRVVGEELKPQRFSVWGAKAVAGIGHLADTLMDRAVVLELRRKLPHENVERLRHAEPDLFQTLSEKLARFAEDNREAVRRARPHLPEKLNDRAQDNWEPLLAIASVAGGSWPELGQRAALKLSGTDSPSMTIGVELLSDIQEIFDKKRADRISTADLIESLCHDDEKPWLTYNRGKQITPRQVSRKLAEFGIRSTSIRIGGLTPKGYMRQWFDESFARYLGPESATSATPPQPSIYEGLHVADTAHVAATRTQSATPKPASVQECCAVADTGGWTDES